METAHIHAPEVEESDSRLSFLEKLRLPLEASRIVRIRNQLDGLQYSELENSRFEAKDQAIEFVRLNEGVNGIEIAFTKALDDEDELKMVVGGHWDWQTGEVCEAYAYQSHFSNGREVMTRIWDPNRYPKPEGQLTTSEVLKTLKRASRSLIVAS